MLAHIFSSLILIVTSLWVGPRYFKAQPLYRRWLWILTVAFFAATAIAALCYFLGLEKNEGMLDFFKGIEATTAYLFLIVICWGLVILTDIQPLLFVGTLVLGGAVFFLTWPQWRVLHPVIQAFCLIVAMLVATFGLARRQRSGFWMVLALMCLAFSSKAHLFESFMHPIDSGHYLKSLALYFSGKALLTERVPLF